MRGPLPLLGHLPQRHLGAHEDRSWTHPPGHDLRARDGSPLVDLRLGPLRRELEAQGVPVDSELGKQSLLECAAAFFESKKQKQRKSYNPGVELMAHLKDSS